MNTPTNIPYFAVSSFGSYSTLSQMVAISQPDHCNGSLTYSTPRMNYPQGGSLNFTSFSQTANCPQDRLNQHQNYTHLKSNKHHYMFMQQQQQQQQMQQQQQQQQQQHCQQKLQSTSSTGFFSRTTTQLTGHFGQTLNSDALHRTMTDKQKIQEITRIYNIVKTQQPSNQKTRKTFPTKLSSPRETSTTQTAVSTVSQETEQQQQQQQALQQQFPISKSVFKTNTEQKKFAQIGQSISSPSQFIKSSQKLFTSASSVPIITKNQDVPSEEQYILDSQSTLHTEQKTHYQHRFQVSSQTSHRNSIPLTDRSSCNSNQQDIKRTNQIKQLEPKFNMNLNLNLKSTLFNSIRNKQHQQLSERTIKRAPDSMDNTPKKSINRRILLKNNLAVPSSFTPPPLAAALLLSNKQQPDKSSIVKRGSKRITGIASIQCLDYEINDYEKEQFEGINKDEDEINNLSKEQKAKRENSIETAASSTIIMSRYSLSSIKNSSTSLSNIKSPQENNNNNQNERNKEENNKQSKRNAATEMSPLSPDLKIQLISSQSNQNNLLRKLSEETPKSQLQFHRECLPPVRLKTIEFEEQEDAEQVLQNQIEVPSDLLDRINTFNEKRPVSSQGRIRRKNYTRQDIRTEENQDFKQESSKKATKQINIMLIERRDYDRTQNIQVENADSREEYDLPLAEGQLAQHDQAVSSSSHITENKLFVIRLNKSQNQKMRPKNTNVLRNENLKELSKNSAISEEFLNLFA